VLTGKSTFPLFPWNQLFDRLRMRSPSNGDNQHDRRPLEHSSEQSMHHAAQAL
jgi:hypothetical protein